MRRTLRRDDDGTVRLVHELDLFGYHVRYEWHVLDGQGKPLREQFGSPWSGLVVFGGPTEKPFVLEAGHYHYLATGERPVLVEKTLCARYRGPEFPPDPRRACDVCAEEAA